ncbi:MAG: glutamine synthetase III [Ignavibacteriales bacterium]|nr:glutamine synthetase III [Ignavibacteriales bacterium]
MTLRFHAVSKANSHVVSDYKKPDARPEEFFGCNVFDLPKMKQFLSKEAYAAVVTARESGGRINLDMADDIARGMKNWAVSLGVSHYAHWFQPLTGATAEKHDTFLDWDFDDKKFIEKFSGTLLVQQEPDASSFPSGGIRSTFEARGYTAWDPASPAFVMESTLCIPSVFISYTGESLDYKAPLLKANAFLDKAATAVCKYFDKNVKRVTSTLGWEQEYFLVDAALYDICPDLILTGRTLLGHSAAKDQQLEDHYFGSIPERVAAYIQELEVEAYKLGIPAKTRHNEVAPNQFEIAPIFEEVDIAVDHNILIMDLMRRLARKHNFAVLMHEKPFAGINGSGKHNNWSLATDTGVNLLQPGKNPQSNLQFVAILVNVLKAVHDNADILLGSIASTGNEHRLGGNEAPPAILSVFLGSYLTDLLEQIEEKGMADANVGKEEIKKLTLDIERIPELILHNTDRNRTSPFAFTGNKFEFRAVGSAANCALGMIVLNTAMAKQLVKFKEDVDALIDAGTAKQDALFQVILRYTVESKAIRFDGNGYSTEWQEEAAKRGLPNATSAPQAWKAFVTEKSHKLFVDNSIFSERELDARYEVSLEGYIKKIKIEANVLQDLAANFIVPTAIKYQNVLLDNVKGITQFLGDEAAAPVLNILRSTSAHIAGIQSASKKLSEACALADAKGELAETAAMYASEVRALFDVIRGHSDELEMVVDNELWPLPKYRELLFIR